MEESWLSKEGIIDPNDFISGKLNIIDAPCGCGKTTFVEKKLWQEAYWGDLLYLIDTKNALEAFQRRGEKKEYQGRVYYKHKGIIAMTYATFAVLCFNKPGEWLWDDEDSLIVCDELQSVIKWSKIKNDTSNQFEVNLHKYALNEIHRRIEMGTRIVAITATPSSIRNEFIGEYTNVPIHGLLKRYHIKRRYSFDSLSTLLPHVPNDKRGIIYTPHITQIQSICTQLNSRGIRAVGFWSVSNEAHPMGKDELRVRDSVVQYGLIPDDVQVLVINAASETGINITSPVDYYIINDSNKDTQIQAIGRVRHDLDTVFYRSTKTSDWIYILDSDFKKKWFNRNLFKEDKTALCTDLYICDKRGRMMKWPKVKDILLGSGLSITDKQEKHGRRYSIIEEGSHNTDSLYISSSSF